MALPSIRSVRKRFREPCARLRSDGRAWAVTLASAIDLSVGLAKRWADLPLFAMILYGQSYGRLATLAEALIRARDGKEPWNDLFSRAKHPNTLYGDVFDAFAKCGLSAAFGPACTIIPAAADRTMDAILTLGRPIGVEMASIGESADDAKANEEFYAKRARRKQRFITDVRYGNTYAAIVRLTEKLLNKVAKGCDVTAGQLVPAIPNLLFIGFPKRTSIAPWHPDVMWAMEDLFSEAPWLKEERERVPTVWSVLRRKVAEAMTREKKRLILPDGTSIDDFMRRDLWPMFRQISGVLLFDECRLAGGMINYNATMRITHREMATVEEAMASADWKPFTAWPEHAWPLLLARQ